MTGWIAALGLLLVAPAVRAQPIDVPDTWGGDLPSRPRLTGSWGGFRDEMGRKGIVLDVDLILTPQAVATGGVDTGADFWGNAEYTLNVDTQKAGLWPGGFLKVVGTSGFGDNILGDSGALVPPNTALLLPATEPSSALMHATFMQFLSPKLGLLAGKIFTVDGMRGEFTGNYRTQFENTGLTFPMAAALVPISAYGGGVVGHPVGAPRADGVGDRPRWVADERRRHRRVRRRRDGARDRGPQDRPVRSSGVTRT
jgi:porin